jgi:FtsH-binding integral membrane protein
MTKKTEKTKKKNNFLQLMEGMKNRMLRKIWELFKIAIVASLLIYLWCNYSLITLLPYSKSYINWIMLIVVSFGLIGIIWFLMIDFLKSKEKEKAENITILMSKKKYHEKMVEYYNKELEKLEK